MGKIEQHHILWDKRRWNSTEESKRLRHRSGLIVPIDVDIHGELHRAIPMVPVPPGQMITKISGDFYPVKKNPVETVLSLMEAVNESTMVGESISRGIGKVMLMALEAQLPFLETSEKILNGTVS